MDRPTAATKFGLRPKSRSLSDRSGSQSEAVNNALTNTVNLAGIPITNKVTGSKVNNDGSYSGNLQNQFSIGGLGLNAGLNSNNAGFGVNKQPGNVGLNLGPLSLAFMNNGGLSGGNSGSGAGNQAQSNAGATATGEGSATNSQTQSGSHNVDLGLLNVQTTYSNSQAQAVSQNGATSANAGSATQANANGGVQPQQNGFVQPGAGLAALFGGRPDYQQQQQQYYPNQRPGFPFSPPPQAFNPFKPFGGQRPPPPPFGPFGLGFNAQQYPQQNYGHGGYQHQLGGNQQFTGGVPNQQQGNYSPGQFTNHGNSAGNE